MAVGGPLLWGLVLCFVLEPAVGVGSISTTPTADGEMLPGSNSSGADYLPILECENGQSSNGLTCNKEGYFIADFQHNVFWDPGELFPDDRIPVPASNSICCRLKNPSSGASSALPVGAVSEGIISVGCHASTNKKVGTMRCEAQSKGGHSFVMGFIDSKSTTGQTQYYYPVDAPICCSPVLKLTSGDALELTRCDCVTSNDVGCDGQNTNRLLWGFEYYGKIRDQDIPLSPALCCKVCLGKKLYDLSDCRDLNKCSGHGACILGACSCRKGWAGSDCSQKVGSGSDSDAWWQSFWWLGVIGFMCAFTGLFATFWMIQRAEWADRTPRRNENEDSLLQWVDVEGSVGSEDTSVSSSDGSHVSATVSLEVASVEDGGNVGNLREAEPREHGISLPQNEENNESTDTVVQETSVQEERGSAATSHEIEAEDSPEEDNCELQKGGDDAEEDQANVKLLTFNSATSPLTSMTCCVCMSRPVQVALVPCGHSNLCRRCARKIQRCPFCRKEIIRRQRLFLSG